MKFVIASDSFKGSLKSKEICDMAVDTISKVFPEAEVMAFPIADGGEGSVDCFLALDGAKEIKASVSGPYHEKIEASYASYKGCAIIEVAKEAGLPLVEGCENPLLTSSFGVGEIIKCAVEKGHKSIVIGLGGSCTNDLGCGMAAALGCKFYDKKGNLFVPTGASLKDIYDIDVSMCRDYLKELKITAMCDVSNPLFGKNGAAYVFAPQKGAGKREVKLLDRGLRKASRLIEKKLGFKFSDKAGAGAAGGMGWGTIAFLNGELKPGIETILDILDFEKKAKDADYIITGEGRLDSQSFKGKLVSGLHKISQKYSIPLVAIVGIMGDVSTKDKNKFYKIYETNKDGRSFAEAKLTAKKDYICALKTFLKEIGENYEKE